MKEGFESILGLLPEYESNLQPISEILLANVVMISEIPSPTFQESDRTKFMLNRFNESQLQNCSTDEVGNALGILPGSQGERNIMVVAHTDTVFPEKVDHTISIEPNNVVGPGVADNGLGLAAVATLPLILEQLKIELRSNLILMGSARSLGKGDIEGLRFFLANSDLPICAGICVEGVELGRLSYSSIGMRRGEIMYRVPEEYDWTRFGAGGAIITINEVINRILEIPLPQRPKTSIVFRAIDGGGSFQKIPTNALLRFEIRSESGSMVREIGDEIENIVAEVSSRTGAEVSYNIFSRREPGGIKFSHPLAIHAREILNKLAIQPRISPSTSELSAFIDKEIPAVTVGLTHGENMSEENEMIAIKPITKGLAQLLALIVATDRGYCNED